MKKSRKSDYLIIGYKPGKKQYIQLNHILNTNGYKIFKGYCLSEKRQNT